MRLSIIVPVFNVDKYLTKCLDSILAQDLAKDEYEIIIVNDGSTDRSGDIAEQYAGCHENIVLINQENQGLSEARNSGIDAAKGEYIQFVDSDDYLEPNVIRTLVKKMEDENLDILRINYQHVNERGEAFWPYKSGKEYVDYCDEVTDGLSFLTERLGYACYAVQFIIKTSLLNDSHIRFTPGMYFEDTEWTPRILVKAKRVTSIDTIVYNYFVRQGSITKSDSIEKKRKIVDDKMRLIRMLQVQSVEVTDKRWYEGMISATVVSLLGCVVTDFFRERKHYIISLKKMNVFPLSSYHISSRMMRKVRLINHSTIIYCWMLKIKSII